MRAAARLSSRRRRRRGVHIMRNSKAWSRNHALRTHRATPYLRGSKRTEEGYPLFPSHLRSMKNVTGHSVPSASPRRRAAGAFAVPVPCVDGQAVSADDDGLAGRLERVARESCCPRPVRAAALARALTRCSTAPGARHRPRADRVRIRQAVALCRPGLAHVPEETSPALDAGWIPTQ